MCTCEHIFCLSEIVQHSVQNCKKNHKKKKTSIVLSIEQNVFWLKLIFVRYLIISFYSPFPVSFWALHTLTSERPLFRSGLFLECLSVFLDGGGGAHRVVV